MPGLVQRRAAETRSDRTQLLRTLLALVIIFGVPKVMMTSHRCPGTLLVIPVHTRNGMVGGV